MRRALAAALMVCAMTACTPSDGKPARTADCARAGARDFDGDGRDDVALGAPWTGAGAVHLLTGGSIVPLTAPELGPHDGFGASLTLAKVNGDGCADLVVGAPYADDGAGAVYILYGGAAERTRKLVARKPRAGALFGWSLASYGDLLAIGAPGENGSAGAVHLARKGVVERTIHQDTKGVPGNADAYDQFGYQVAIGPLDSGRIGLAIGAPYEMEDGTEPGEGEAGAVTVLQDVEAPQLAGARLVPPQTDDAGLCGFGHSLVYAKGFVVGASDCGKIQFYGLDLKPTRTVNRPSSAPVHEPCRLAASADGRVAALWPGPAPTLMELTTKERQLHAGGLEAGRAVTFSGNSLVVGLRGDPRAAVAIVDDEIALIKAPGLFETLS